MPSPVRPGRPRSAPVRNSSFSIGFFLLSITIGVCLFAGTVAFIRFWQRLDPLEAWTRGHPRLNPGTESQKSESEALAVSPASCALLCTALRVDPTLASLRCTARHLQRRRAAPGWAPERAAWISSPSSLGDREWAPRHRQGGGLSRQTAWHLTQAEVNSAEPQRTFQEELRRARAGVAESDSTAAGNEGRERGNAAATKRGSRLYPLSRRDLVVAIPTHKATEPQIKAGRSNRLGLRTVVITNYTEDGDTSRYPVAADEVWTSYPDASPTRSFYPGDDRAALAPFLAFRALGDTFKWLFYGDDDTVLFADAALRLAETMDPDLPYFVTDNLWFSPLFGGAWHPHPLAPRCLPCGFQKNVTAAVGMEMAAGCPCTPSLICGLSNGYNGTFQNGGCGVPRTPARAYSMHGGAGALISIGLLRQIDWRSMERCVNHQWSSGGDAFITICLWEQGFAHTTPDPTWHPAGLQMFDPSPPVLNPDDFITWKASHVLGNMLQAAAGVCEGLCKLEVDNTVSIHLRARRTGGSDEGAAAFVRAFSRLYSRLTGYLTLEGEPNLADTTDQWTARIAASLDAQQAAATDVVRKLLRLQEDAHIGAKGTTADLDHDFGPQLGVVSANDAIRSGIADAVASRLLANIMRMVEPFAEGKTAEESVKAAGLPGEGLEDLITQIGLQTHLWSP